MTVNLYIDVWNRWLTPHFHSDLIPLTLILLLNFTLEYIDLYTDDILIPTWKFDMLTEASLDDFILDEPSTLVTAACWKCSAIDIHSFVTSRYIHEWPDLISVIWYTFYTFYGILIRWCVDTFHYIHCWRYHSMPFILLIHSFDKWAILMGGWWWPFSFILGRPFDIFCLDI